jgi:hypothetical protein
MGPEGWSLLGDLTNDGIVNGCDYSAMVMEDAGAVGVSCGDINRDGAVDMYDIAELAGQWLAETTWH